MAGSKQEIIEQEIKDDIKRESELEDLEDLAKQEMDDDGDN